jgi:hypothetical protein
MGVVLVGGLVMGGVGDNGGLWFGLIGHSLPSIICFLLLLLPSLLLLLLLLL